ncbi:MAG TPA: hypothetical protein VIK91_03305 [Nannocystis sp.]
MGQPSAPLRTPARALALALVLPLVPAEPDPARSAGCEQPTPVARAKTALAVGDEPAAGCAKTRAVGPEPLAGGFSSLDALGAAVVAALNAGDAAALAALTVTRDEYIGRLFPALANHPAAEAFGRELLWDLHARQSRDDMQRALAHHGRADLRYVRLEPRGRLARAGVIFHERPRLVVTDRSGAERSLQLLASVIEHEATGTYKLLGFRDHE